MFQTCWERFSKFSVLQRMNNNPVWKYLNLSFPLVGNLSSKKDAGQAGMTNLGVYYKLVNQLI